MDLKQIKLKRVLSCTNTVVRGLFFTALIFLFTSACNGLSGTQPSVYAETPEISQDTTNFLVKISQAMAEISEAVKPTIVNISTKRTEKITESPFAPFLDNPLFKEFRERFKFPKQQRERRTLGSGVIISSDGYILTNNHVIRNAEEIKVSLSDKREFWAEIIGTDPQTDIAVIKIDAEDLPAITLGDSDKLRVGEIVLAIGGPYGLTQTVTMGIVSAVGRANVGIASYEDFIQTDAAINPGNSGGALVNARGKLVGINTAIFSSTGGYQGIGFAIPSNMAKSVAESLIKEGRVIRGWLGVSVKPITPEIAKQFDLEEEYGALVDGIIEDSPAEKAGIMKDDIIIEYNGDKVYEPYSLRNRIANTPPGEVAELKVIREGSTEIIMVKIGELPSETKTIHKDFKNALRGVRVQDLTQELYWRLNIPEEVNGVVVIEIKKGSPMHGKLIPGDVIQEVNEKAVTNLEDFKSIVSKIKHNESVELFVFRKGFSVSIKISPIEAP